MPADPLPIGSSYTPRDFAQSALYKGPSENASKRISKIQLLKDTRTSDHWRHEFIVFTIDHGQEELYLYFERELDEVVESWKDMVGFACTLFQGKALDILMFHELGSETDAETKAFAKEVFQIRLGSEFTLKDLAKILDSVSYEEKYPRYGLFSANCWAWSRGLLFDIIFDPRVVAPEILKTNGRDMVSTTVEEMKLYMLTEYGAYGRLLLHFSSDDFNAQSRFQTFPKLLYPYGIRITLLLYSILRPLVQLKNTIIGPSNWTVALRTLLVYHDQTLESTAEGRDCTFLPLHPNFTDFIQVIPEHMDYALPTSLCHPGKYLYLLTSPVCSASQPVSAVHIYVFGATSGVAGDRERDSPIWLSCGIIRRTEGSGDLVEVPTHARLITRPRGVNEGSSVEYSAIQVFNSDDELTRALKHGDMVALWAHCGAGQLHTPRSASIKVVVSERPVRIIDWILALYLIYEILRLVFLGGSYAGLAASAVGCLLYWTNTWCEGWLWSTLSDFALTLHASVTPLSLPPDSTSEHHYTLPAFLKEPITSDIFSPSLHSIELLQEERGAGIVIAAFAYQGASYAIHFGGPSAVHAGWRHCLSFLTKPHRLDEAAVRIFREGGTERAVRAEYRAHRSVLAIHFDGADESPGAEQQLRALVGMLHGVQRRYWRCFWLNGRGWSWQWALLAAALRRTARGRGWVAVRGRRCAHSEEAEGLLRDGYREWRDAEGREYGTGFALERMGDVVFVVTQTRAVWIFLLAACLSWWINPMVNAWLIRMFPFMDV